MLATFYTDNPQFYVAVDCIIFGFEKKTLKVLIQHRDFEPFEGQPSLMGTFVQNDERVVDAARRILRERTGLEDAAIHQVGAFGDLDRDPGARVISVCYFAIVNREDCNDDLNKKFNGFWADVNDMPQLIFDHNRMVKKAHRQLQNMISYTPIGLGLLKSKFTLTQLQTIYEAILGEALDKRNFRKRVAEMKFIEETGEIDKTTSKRGARLFRFNQQAYDEEGNFKL